MRWRLIRPEWGCAAALSIAAGLATAGGYVRIGQIDVALFGQLAAPFAAGVLGMVALVAGEGLIRGLSAAAQAPWRRAIGWAGAILALAVWALTRLPWGGPVAQLVDAAASSAIAMAAFLAVFLPLAGLIRVRFALAAVAQTMVFWAPLLVFLLVGGLWLTALRAMTPQVWDPVLARMDLSLGFFPSEALFNWEIDRNWVERISNAGYLLLGLMIAGVAARLHLAGAASQARRCLLALLLVGTLGVICYGIVPAIGPVHAFRGLFERAGAPGQGALADGIRRAIADGPDRMAGGPFARNAFPSLHTAFALVALSAAWSWRRRFFWLCLPVGLLQVATAMTLCVHYAVDLFAAVPFAALCWWAADRGVRATARATDEPLPPLAARGGRLTSGNLGLGVALAVSAAALCLWARVAPMPAWAGWVLAAVIVVGPAWASLRVNRHLRAEATRPAGEKERTFEGRSIRLLTWAVFCSGGIALVLEQIYEKYLSTILGASRPASAIVLAVYGAGLALGAWACPKGPAGAARRLAALELFIAAWAMLVGLAFFASDRAFASWLPAGEAGGLALAAARAAVAALWILPPAWAMGAQVPTLAAVLGSHPVWRSQGITRFYAVNLAGAFAFTLATPPLLFCTVGADGALWTIAGLGAVVGAALWFGLPAAGPSHGLPRRSRWLNGPPVFARRTRASPWQSPVAVATAETGGRGPPFVAFAAGFGFFALEVVWLHLISAVCGASTFSFSILLALILLGLALGARRVDRATVDDRASWARLLGWLVVALALGGACWPWAGRLMARIEAARRFEWFWAGETLKLVVVGLIVLPSAALAGQIFPRLLRRFEGVGFAGRPVGLLCGANLVGALAGALVTGFALIPAFGAEHTLQLLASTAGAVGLALAIGRPPAWAGLWPAAIGLCLLAFLPRWNRLELTRGYGVYLAAQISSAARLAFFREDFSAGFVTVVSAPASGRITPVKTLLENGKFEADDAGEMPAQIGFGLVAALHAPAADRALVIGCGSGQTVSVIARLGFDRVDLAEISAAHLAAARANFGQINGDVLDRPNVAVHLEDGRNFLLRSTHRYDLIQIEVTSVWFAGATDLYSREFYALVREHLALGGVLAQWVQLHHLGPHEIASILATAQAEFPAVSLWRAGGQACLLASAAPPPVNPAIWVRWRRSPALAGERAVAGLTSPAAFAATELLPPGRMLGLLRRTPAALNTDRNRWLEFQTPQYYLSRRDLRRENLLWLEAPIGR